MKHLLVLLLWNTIAAGQAVKYEFTQKPVKDGPFVHLVDEPAKIFNHKTSIHALGVWVAAGSSSPPSGPSVSDIYCSRDEYKCHEEMANIVWMGDTFSLNPDSADYRVTRWNEREIVAENRDVQGPLVAGPCHLLGVLKIELVHQKIYAYQTLTEPAISDESTGKIIASRKLCEAANNTLWELHAETSFSYAPNAKTLFKK